MNAIAAVVYWYILFLTLYSTITSWTKEKEAEAFKNMLEKVYITCLGIQCITNTALAVSKWTCGLCQ